MSSLLARGHHLREVPNYSNLTEKLKIWYAGNMVAYWKWSSRTRGGCTGRFDCSTIGESGESGMEDNRDSLCSLLKYYTSKPWSWHLLKAVMFSLLNDCLPFMNVKAI